MGTQSGASPSAKTICLKPLLEHQHVPDLGLPRRTGLVRLPEGGNFSLVENPLSSDPVRGEEVFCPGAEGLLPEPLIDRDGESLLGAIHQFLWHVLIENVPKDELSPGIVPKEVIRKGPGKGDHIPVQEGDSRLQGDRHGGPVHLGEDVIRVVEQKVGQHRLPERGQVRISLQGAAGVEKACGVGCRTENAGIPHQAPAEVPGRQQAGRS